MKLHTSLEIQNILDLDETKSKMTLKMAVTIEWVDPRIKFLHLKKDENRNILTSEEMKQLWMPSIVFVNTKYSLQLDFHEGYGIVEIQNGKQF